MKKETQAQIFSNEFCKISRKNILPWNYNTNNSYYNFMVLENAFRRLLLNNLTEYLRLKGNAIKYHIPHQKRKVLTKVT